MPLRIILFAELFAWRGPLSGAAARNASKAIRTLSFKISILRSGWRSPVELEDSNDYAAGSRSMSFQKIDPPSNSMY